MSPSPQDNMQPDMDPGTAELDGEDIVITGLSGIFPSSDNVVQFMENLYNKVDMVENTVPHWRFNHPEMPKHLGSLKNLDRFDAHYFRVPYGQVLSMEAMNRKVLENAYSAIFDAGVNPLNLAGSKLGVFVGTSFTDSGTISIMDFNKNNTYIITGSCKTMLANRISYWINSKSPSYTLDQGCASSMTCLEHAYWNMKKGYCDSAIVGGCNTCIHPVLSLNLKRAGFLCLDGKTKCFDKHGDGYVRSEAVNILFLQKAKDAKRVYAQVCAVKGNFIQRPDQRLSFVRKTEDMVNFMKNVYTEVNVLPKDVEYVEASAPGIAEADACELEAIEALFARDTPLKVGSVKSNMGHSEGASGLCSVTKICLANHTGKLPANLHYQEPQTHIPAVRDGRIQVLTEHAPYNRGYVALNSISYTGYNVHVLLKGHFKKKIAKRYETSIPRLITVSGRTDSSLDTLFDDLKNNPIDPEKIALMHGIFERDNPNHIIRGYIIVDTNKDNETITLAQNSDYYPGEKNPVWFLYSGMGSQWPGMGTAFMQIPIFAAAIEKCCRVLEPKGINLMRILTDPDESIFDNILHSFVGIAAMQIGLTDLLRSIGIVPDNLIGHSVGELGCAYADGCFTAEDMIISSCSRGIASTKTELIRGSMAAVGLGYRDISKICPPEIEVACHNSSESSTISGPASDIKKFVNELKERGIFAKEVNTANIAYHSRYIADAGPVLLADMKKYIKTPKLRSKKWLSTSVLPENWDQPEAKYASAEYFTNNLLYNVYFEEVATMIPANAIVIEVSPHGLMQAIVKRSHPNCTHVPLTKRNHPDPSRHLLESIGKLYMAGLNPKIDVLYPKVQFPVSTETPILSHLVGWEHSEEWPLISYNKQSRIYLPSREIIMSIQDDDWKFLKGCVKNDIIVLPEAMILVLVWETLAMYKGVHYKKLSVVFSEIQIHRQINFSTKDTVKLNIMILKGSKKFEVSSDDTPIASGFINDEILNDINSEIEKSITDEEVPLSLYDIYTMMNLRGYSYTDEFQSIYSSNLNRNKAIIKWTGDWIIFLDSLIQFSVLSRNNDGVSTLKYIHELVVNTDVNNTTEKLKFDDVCCFEAWKYDGFYNTIQCAGVEIKNVIFNDSLKPKFTMDLFETAVSNNHHVEHNHASVTENIKLISTESGEISNLAWTTSSCLESSNNLVQVHYAGPSLRDCQKAVHPVDESYGMDFSGINKNGTRVMGVVSEGALGTAVEADPDLLWPVPDHWSLEDAATVPLPYLLAYYCLKIRADLTEKQTVLVTGGAGALGQAAISLCLSLNCHVITTVSDIQKKLFLQRLFPRLKDENIRNSRDVSFNTTLTLNSKIIQCDLVINCANEKLHQTAMKCVNMFGTILNINEFDAYENNPFGMAFLVAGRQYKVIRLSNIFHAKNWEDKKNLQLMISEGIAKGIVQPLSRVVYSPADVTRAFRLLSVNKNRGRVLIKMEDLNKMHAKLNIIPRLTLNGNECFVVICAENGFGIELVDRLIQRGARKIVINRERSCGYFQLKLHSWIEKGVSVEIYSGKLTSEKECQKLLQYCNNVASIQYVFIVKHLEDDTYRKNNIEGLEQFSESVLVADLDSASRKVCPELRKFVVVTMSEENNNEEIQKICKLRVEDGFPTLVFKVQLNDEFLWNSETFLMNIKPQKLAAILDSLETKLKSNNISSNLKQHTDCNFLYKIAKIIGTESIELYEDNIKLSYFSTNEVILEEIKNMLYKVCEIDFALEDLMHMTIANLKALSDKQTENKDARNSGFDAFYTYIDNDECEAAEPLVIMPTIVNMKYKLNEGLDPKETYLIMVPGFEGHRHIYKSICSSLKIKAMAVQFNTYFLEDSIPEMAKSIIKQIKTMVELKSKFYLLGYSFGVNIALELAALLEKEGHIGVVYCLDSSPDALKVQLNAHLGNSTNGQLENSLLEHMYHIISGRDGQDIRKSIENIDSWMEKVEICIQNLSCLVNYTKEYIKTVIQAAYKRILLAQEYKPDMKLKSDLVLIKGSPHPEAKGLADDYNLSKYTTRPAQVFNIESDHALAPYDCKVPNIVNRLLAPELLQDFKQKNLCDFYYNIND